MTRTRFFALLAVATVVSLTALAVTAVGSVTKRPTVSVRSTSLGKILVNSQGRTLYMFKKDSGRKSACTGACAKAWPPLRAKGKPTAGGGASASKIGTISRSDGKPQVTYKGHPLYTFQNDKKAGQTNGEGLTAFGASWFALSPAGSQVSGNSSHPGASTPSPGGSGY